MPKESNSTNTLVDNPLACVAAGINTLLAVQLKSASDTGDEDVFAACLSAMATLVRVFDGEDKAKELLDFYTNGAMSKIDGKMEDGMSFQEAVDSVGEEDSNE